MLNPKKHDWKNKVFPFAVICTSIGNNKPDGFFSALKGQNSGHVCWCGTECFVLTSSYFVVTQASVSLEKWSTDKKNKKKKTDPLNWHRKWLGRKFDDLFFSFLWSYKWIQMMYVQTDCSNWKRFSFTDFNNGWNGFWLTDIWKLNRCALY